MRCARPPRFPPRDPANPALGTPPTDPLPSLRRFQARAALAEAATAREAAREASNEQARAREEVEKAQLVVEEAVRTHTAQVRAASTAAATSAAAEAKAEALQAAAQSLAAALSALEGGSPDAAAPVVAAEAVPM